MFTRISHISLIISCYCSQPIGHLCTPPPFLARSFDKGIILVLAKSFGEIRHLVDSQQWMWEYYCIVKLQLNSKLKLQSWS